MTHKSAHQTQTERCCQMTGDAVRNNETDQGLTSSPAVVGGKVVIGPEDGSVYCFGAKEKK